MGPAQPLANAEDVKDLFNGLDSLPWEDEVEDMVDSLIAADVAEVKHGKWIVTDSDDGMCESYAAFIEFCCSECGLSVGFEDGEYDWYYGDPIPWKSCPMCCAIMDGDNNVI